MSKGKARKDRYVNGETVPKSVPKGRVLVHNHVIHGTHWPCGVNGFRAWTSTKPPPGFVPCPCGYAGLEHYAWAEFVKAYRKDPKAYKRKVLALELEDEELLLELDAREELARKANTGT